MSAKDLTTLFDEARNGDARAFDTLFERVYAELKKLARVVRSDSSSETMNTTALVHEAYERLLPGGELHIEDRSHFFRLAARAMRFVLVDSARKQSASKRGGSWQKVTLSEEHHSDAVDADSVIALDDALRELESMDERKARVVECRYFAGLTIEETAVALSVSTPTVERDWRAARAWLAANLSEAQ
ncbi:MAG: sigma-70 family RNA polymerase sigma factor [Rhodothermales bacterium]|nr:sigma-70 family RNA polymerase sigma factor [Rhodothermales bacterium]